MEASGGVLRGERRSRATRCGPGVRTVWRDQRLSSWFELKASPAASKGNSGSFPAGRGEASKDSSEKQHQGPPPLTSRAAGGFDFSLLFRARCVPSGTNFTLENHPYLILTFYPERRYARRSRAFSPKNRLIQPSQR